MQISDVLMLVGGLALFLYGIRQMGDGLELAAGSRLKKVLEKLTKNRVLGVLMGVGVTALIQSSSATTVMVVGFVNAGLMELTQAISVIMGANIGTTVTAQLIALDIDMIAPVFAFIGVIIIMTTKKRVLQALGQVIIGLGILFIGMGQMSAALRPMREVEAFRNLMVSFSNPLLGVAAGALFTGVIQSSSASVGILQALAKEGLVGIDSAVFVLFGQNIGTCVTALIASIGTSTNARRSALAHLLFNVIGTALFIGITMLLPFTDLVRAITPADTVKQIANAHTIFNIVTTALLLPLSGLLAKLVTRLVPDKPSAASPLARFDEHVFGATSLAMETMQNEANAMRDLVGENLELSFSALIDGKPELKELIEPKEERIDQLNKDLAHVFVRVNSMELNTQDAARVSALFTVISNLERIGDHAYNIAGYAGALKDRYLFFSPAGIEEIKELRRRIVNIFDDAWAYFIDAKSRDGKAIQRQEDDIDELTERYQANHVERLSKGECSPDAGVMFVEIMIDLERIADHAMNIKEAFEERMGD